MTFQDLHAETVGEIEVESKVLVIKRIKQFFHITADEQDRETIERVLSVYADSCPVARSVKDSIEITSELELTGA
ncbi:MAG: OsmC family protein [Rubrobacter sp.]|nr:OsmC family protein [Rubrobacter sp.]